MKNFIPLLFLTFFLFSMGCENKNEEEEKTGVSIIEECKGMPGYISAAGFVPGKPFGFSVAEKGVTGLSLIQFPGKGVRYKMFRLPSWEAAGHLGAVITDKNGNSYVIPRPFINTLKNNPEDQNTIYKINTADGQMQEYIRLKPAKAPGPVNPFGLMGLVFDCENEIIYASSVAGSDAGQEQGCIYAIQTGDDPKVIATLTGVDPMGVGVCYFNGRKSLFYGKARSSEIYSIELSPDGSFAGDPEKVLTLALLGERGDDKPRKIRFDNHGNLIASGVSFNFNLANSADKLENIYTFQYNLQTGIWDLRNIRKGIQ